MTRVLKRNLAGALAAALVLGGGTMAWAAAGGTSGATSAADKPVDPAKSASLRQCFPAAGVIRSQEPTEAQRQAVKACLAPLEVPIGDFHGPGDATVGPTKSAAIRDCFSNTGVVKGETPSDAQRQALKACVAAAGITTGEHQDGPGDHQGFPSKAQ